jgi:transcriptional regulator with PAS, ATPase and Fis domain
MQSTLLAWAREFPASVTVCDRQGIILEMNDRAARTFAGDGGRDLIGSSVYDCHPEPARSKLERLMDAGTTNVYTIEKHGVRKLIYQSPWFQDGQYAGFVEISFEIPRDMPHLMSG